MQTTAEKTVKLQSRYIFTVDIKQTSLANAIDNVHLLLLKFWIKFFNILAVLHRPIVRSSQAIFSS